MVAHFGGALADGITGVGTMEVGTFEDHLSAGFTTLPGPLLDGSIGDDISSRMPSESSAFLTPALERRKTFSNPMVRKKNM
jgi:hypothetical protein